MTTRFQENIKCFGSLEEMKGYADAMKFLPPYPPDMSVLAAEYMTGFKQGRIDRKL
jgi:hypothetical protein